MQNRQVGKRAAQGGGSIKFVDDVQIVELLGPFGIQVPSELDLVDVGVGFILQNTNIASLVSSERVMIET